MSIVYLQKIRNRDLPIEKMLEYCDDLHVISVEKYAKDVSDEYKKKCKSYTVVESFNIETLYYLCSGINGLNLIICYSEEDLFLAAILRKILNISGDSYDYISLFRNKKIMKSYLIEKINNLIIPKYYFQTDELKTLDKQRKYVLKPYDSMSCGNITIGTLDELLYGTQGIIPGGYIIEEYIELPLLHVDGFISEHLELFQPYEYTSPPINLYKNAVGGLPIDSGCDLYSKLKEVVIDILIHMNVRNSCFHIELFFDRETLCFYFCEIGKRFGGGPIVSAVLKDTGYQLPLVWFKNEIGNCETFKSSMSYQFTGWVEIPITTYGLIEEINIPVIENVQIEIINQDYFIGDTILEPSSGYKRIFSLLITSRSQLTLKNAMDCILAYDKMVVFKK